MNLGFNDRPYPKLHLYDFPSITRVLGRPLTNSYRLVINLGRRNDLSSLGAPAK